MIFKRSLSAAAFAMFVAGVAVADTSSMNADVTGMGILENNYVRAGVNGTAGTFGSGGNTSPGLLFDSTGTGTFNTAYDYLTPGSPFDGFAVKIDGTNYANNNGRTNAIANDGNGLTDGTDSLSWTGNWTHDSTTWSITNTYTLGTTSPYVDITSTITAGSAATALSFGRFIDPDARAADGDSSRTDNVLGYGVIPSTNVAFSEALSSRYALGLYSTDTNVDAGITMWTTDADSYTENSVDGDGSLTNSGDNTIGLSWNFGGVSAGDILTASYAYIFGPSAFAAADSAITGGAGGGDTTTTSGWGTLTDIGSATDAASGASTPVITYSDPTVDTGRPVLTASITTHTSVIGADVQTIERETTTTTTTPMEIITYTDGVETARTDTTSVIATAVTDPGSFVGRIDQIDSAAAAIQSSTRGLQYSTINGISRNHSFDNGMSGRTSGVIFGGTVTTDNGYQLRGGMVRLSTDLDGNGDTIAANTTGVGFGIANNFSVGSISLDLKYHSVDLDYTRTIGDFSNAGNTSGNDRSVSIMYTGNGETLRPVIGYSFYQRSLDSFAETGSIQSALSGLDYNATERYATIGGAVSVGIVDVTALRHTDGVNQLNIGIEHETESFVYNINAERTVSDLGDSTGLQAGIRINF
jgi:hypothetical protein